MVARGPAPDHVHGAAQQAGAAWSAPSLLGMGTLGSRPWATGGPDGSMDVFWRGSADDNLWLASYLPGRGWGGPQNLGGHLYPVSW